MKTASRSLGLLVCAGLLSVMVHQKALAQWLQNEYSRMGIKGGLNISSMFVDRATSENPRVSWHAGLFAQVLATEHFALQPELNYSTQGTRIDHTFEGRGAETDLNLNYVNLPVLAVFKLGKVAEIHAGAYGAYLARADIDTNGSREGFNSNDRENFRDWDVGAVAGIGFNIKALQIGARYSYGFIEVAKSNGASDLLGNSTNAYGQVYLSINLNPQHEHYKDLGF